MTQPSLTLRSLKVTPVRVPMRLPLGTSAARVTHAPFLLLALETEEGITGHAYAFLYVDQAARAVASFLTALEEAVRGHSVTPIALAAVAARRFRLLGLDGSARAAAALLDMAAWDVLARVAGMPLFRLLGGEARPLRAYNSSGLGLREDAQAVAAEAEEMVSAGFGAVKLRLGHADAAHDLAAFRAVRRRLHDSIEIMVDYNQALDRPGAVLRGRMLAGEGAVWLEEPLPHADLAGYAALRASLAAAPRVLPVQIGENFTHPRAVTAALAAGAADLIMPDLERIGGVTGWVQAAGIAAAEGVAMSSHLYPEVSAHLLCATPTADWLEWVDWMEPLLKHPLKVANGLAYPSEVLGNGLDWNLEAVREHAVEL